MSRHGDATGTERGARRAVADAPEARPEKAWQQTLLAYRWPLVIVALALIGLGFYALTLRQAGRAAATVGDMVGTAADRAKHLAETFLSGDVTETFIASIPEIHGTGSGRLELATSEVVETFSRSDERRVLWDRFSLGTTTTEIQVPVTYRYHLRLADPWRVEASGQVCVVYAPPIRPTQPPAIHTDRMQQRAEQSWLRFDAEEQLDELQQSITPRLIERASDERHLALVRDASRRTVAEFVRTWLLREGQWRSDRFHTIKVLFPDEDGGHPESLDVTIELREGAAASR